MPVTRTAIHDLLPYIIAMKTPLLISWNSKNIRTGVLIQWHYNHFIFQFGTQLITVLIIHSPNRRKHSFLIMFFKSTNSCLVICIKSSDMFHRITFAKLPTPHPRPLHSIIWNIIKIPKSTKETSLLPPPRFAIAVIILLALPSIGISNSTVNHYKWRKKKPLIVQLFTQTPFGAVGSYKGSSVFTEQKNIRYLVFSNSVVFHSYAAISIL